MSTKTVILQVTKAEVHPETLPILVEKVYQFIHQLLFDWLRPANDALEKELKEDKKKAIELSTRFPEIQYWKNPSDQELMESISHPKSDINGRGGWEYSVTEETMFVNGKVKVYVKGHTSDIPIKSFSTLPEFPGLRISIEVKNDE